MEGDLSEAGQAGQPVVAFGPFRLRRDPTQLWQGDQPVRLGGRALDLLVALAEQPGHILSRAELEARVWPHTIVEDSSLRVHIAALRKALGDGVGGARFIANVPGRGYSFVGALRMPAARAAASPFAPTAAPSAPSRLPVRLTSLVGRDAAAASLAACLSARRLVTIVGHGGIGKTSLAVEVAAGLRERYPDGTFFVDLAPLTNGALVCNVLANALGIDADGDDALGAVVGHALGRRMLLVLDNCEHLRDAVVDLVAQVLARTSGIDLLATSREPLHLDGEAVHLLAPLALPPDSPALTWQEAMAFPALQLLVERARASLDTFELDQAQLPAALQLCRRLDGVPLAIEFAAARVGLLGLQGIVDQLDDRLRLLGSGRRTVLPRHRTLRALIDWSYELLSTREQRVLRCCAVFNGPFTMQAAVAVIAAAGLAPAEVRAAIVGLVTRSLLTVDAGDGVAWYALLSVTRAYALERFGADADYPLVARRHALAALAALAALEADWALMPRAAWMTLYQRALGNLRAAHDWAFGVGGDAALGVRLTAAILLPAAPLFGEHELDARARTALAAIDAGAPADALVTTRLHTMLTNGGQPARWFAVAFAGPALPACFGAALDEAVARGDIDVQVEALYYIGATAFGAGDYRSAGEHARRAGVVARAGGDAAVVLHTDRVGAQAAHFLGHHEVGRRMAERVLAVAAFQPPPRLSSPVSPGASMRIVLARVLWLQGCGAQAAVLADDAVDMAQADVYPAELAQALCLAAIPVALWRGERAQAAALVARLGQHVARHRMAYWSTWFAHFNGLLGGAAAAAPVDGKLADHLASFGDGAHLAGALARCDAGLVGWPAPEVLRLAGERACTEHGPADARVEALLQRALRLAQQQQAHAWSLRAATSLARLWVAQGRAGAAAALLTPALADVAEDHGGADYRAALALLAGDAGRG